MTRAHERFCLRALAATCFTGTPMRGGRPACDTCRAGEQTRKERDEKASLYQAALGRVGV